MKKLVFLSMLLVAAVAVQAQGVALKTFEDSTSYAIGRDIFYNMTQQWQRQNLPINTEVAVQAMMDCARGNDKWDNAMAQELLGEKYVDSVIAKVCKDLTHYTVSDAQFAKVRKTLGDAIEKAAKP